MTELVEKRCKPCEGGTETLSESAVADLMPALHPGWAVSADGKGISREFTFPAFSWTIAFVNAVAWVATTEGHHPDMTVSYGRCVVRYSTHAIDGLSDNDFICAAKVDRIAADS
jgi:4a-hydroxytetrahydrobiopterin dehydratase